MPKALQLELERMLVEEQQRPVLALGIPAELTTTAILVLAPKLVAAAVEKLVVK